MRTIWPFGHLGLKFMSFGLAVMLWMTVSGEETVERGLRVPLELQQFPSGLEISGEAPSTVDVRVRGTSAALSRVSPGELVGVLDLHTARAGNRLFHLTPEQVRAPFGVEVVQVAPSTVALSFENSASRLVPVVASVDGRPAPGYVVGKVIVTPDSVEIVGAESAVKRVNEALTEPVLVTGARDRVQEVVTVGVLDPAVRLKTQRTATVAVQVVPAPLERTFRNRPVHLKNLNPNLSAVVVPLTVDVSLRGSREVLNRIEPDDVTAYIDLTNLQAGVYPLDVHADVSHDAGIFRIEPKSAQVRITSARN